MSKQSNHDGWGNVITGVGIRGRDARTATKFLGGTRLPDQTLMDLFQYNGIGKRIISMVAGDMVRKWITVPEDTDGNFLQELKRLKAKTFFKEQIIWGRLFGGALIVMGVDDGLPLEKPVNQNAIKGIRYLHVFDRTRVSIQDAYRYQNPQDEKFGEPALYYINNQYGVNFYVHESRCLVYDGELVPIERRTLNAGWGDAVFQAIYSELEKTGSVFDSVDIILRRYNQGVMSVKNLAEKISSKDGEEEIKTRIEILSLMMSILNMAIMDADGETFQTLTSNIAGIPDMIDRFQVLLSSVTGIPITRLFGRSPAGMNATGDSDEDIYFDTISDKQEEKLLPELEKLVGYINQSKEFKGKLADWTIEFNPLKQMTDMEKATFRKTVAETDHIYVTDTVLDPSEVGVSRFGGNKYSMETVIDTEIRKMPEEMGGEEKTPPPVPPVAPVPPGSKVPPDEKSTEEDETAA